VVRAIDIEALRRDVSTAVQHNQSGRAAEAARRFESLRRRIAASGDERADVLVQHSRVMLGLSSSRLDISGDFAASLVLLASAEDLAARAGAKHMQAAIRGQRGLFFLRVGETVKARVALDHAVELIDEAEPFDQITILLNRGALHLEDGSLGPANADLSRCASTARETGHRQLEFMARHNLGYVEFLAGNIPRSLTMMAEAAAVSEGPRHPVALLDHARVLREAGLVRDADGLLQEASEGFLSGKLFQDLGETELVRADCALAEGDALTALALAASARKRFVKRNNVRWHRKAELAVLRAEYAAADSAGPGARRRMRRLAARAATLSALCQREGRSDLARQAALLEAQCLLNAGDQTPAVTQPRIRSDDSISTRMVIREVRARAARGRDDRAATQREIRAGLAELRSYQASFGSLDLRTASALHGVSLARLDLEVALRSGRPGDVLASIERSRSASSRLAQVRPPADDETASLLAELRQVEETMRGLEGDAESLDSLSRLRSRVSTLQRAIRERGWYKEGISRGPSMKVVTLAQVREAVRADGCAFASYVTHRGRWLAVVVTGSRAEIVPLAAEETVEELVRRVRADLDALAMPRLPGPIRQVVERSLSMGLSRLDESMVAPLRVADAPLVVSAGGALVVLPWSLLPSRRGLPVVATPCASAWVKARSATPPAKDLRVDVVAGPELHRARDEAVRVHKSWPGSMLLVDAEATADAVCRTLAASDVVHIAAHGTHQQESPLFSSVRLSGGPLYAYELDAGAGMASCVVLSACEAGLSTVRPGDEGLGLTSVLLHFGTKSVLAGVARVRDDEAADVMERVHRMLALGSDSASALALAQVECADAEAPAPFVCFGAAWHP
jgi:tetratricopeptide (TPR) repeat protein